MVDLVAETRELCARQLTIDVWKQLGHGQHRRIQVMEQLVHLLENEPNSSIRNLNLSSFVALAQTHETSFYESFLSQVCHAFPEYTQLLSQYCATTIRLANKQALEQFRASILRPNTPLDYVHMEWIAYVLQINLFFFKEGQLYETFIIDRSYPCILLAWIDQVHFELVGKVNAHRRVERILPFDDSIMARIQSKND
jgi:hypothetical protein